ncbi:MAG: hypothetical protein ACR2LL_10385 [Nitrosopumilus sp.]
MTVTLYGFWIVFMLLDMRITLSIHSLIVLHESNTIFRNLYAKYKPSIAIILQLLIEISFVILIPSLIFPREFDTKLFFDYQTSTILAGVVGVIHFLAWNSNRHTVKILQNK